MTDHSDIVGGSSAARVIGCPKSVDVNRGVHSSSSYAQHGTVLHNAMAHILDGKLGEDNLPDSAVITMHFDNGDGAMEMVTGEDWKTCIEPCLDYFDTIEGAGEGFLVEQSVAYPGLDDVFGTADVIFFNGILDWKFGAGVFVEAKNNSQGRFYLWSAIHDPRTAHLFTRGPGTKYEIHVAQPLRDNFDYEVVTWEQLQEFDAQLKTAVSEALGPDPSAAFGPWCTFCHKQGCPLLDGAVEVAKPMLDGYEAPRDFAELLELADQLEAWVKGVRERARETLNQGHTIEGWKLIKAYGHLAWLEKDDAKLARKIRERTGLTADQYRTKGVITPTQAQSLYKKHMSEKTGKPMKEFLLPKGMAARPERGTKLVRQDAKGDPVVSMKDTIKQVADRLHATVSK